jgi:catechol 2,3-dioxygenase-like lactoylglutathione lyase family enzyme
MQPPAGEPPLDDLHHVAISVGSVPEAVAWYTGRFRCRVEYQDATWALLALGNVRLALVTAGEHPPHLGFFRPDAERFGRLKPHRDGTRSVYIEDPWGNAVEILQQP